MSSSISLYLCLYLLSSSIKIHSSNQFMDLAVYRRKMKYPQSITIMRQFFQDCARKTGNSTRKGLSHQDNKGFQGLLGRKSTTIDKFTQMIHAYTSRDQFSGALVDRTKYSQSRYSSDNRTTPKIGVKNNHRKFKDTSNKIFFWQTKQQFNPTNKLGSQIIASKTQQSWCMAPLTTRTKKQVNKEMVRIRDEQNGKMKTLPIKCLKTQCLRV